MAITVELKGLNELAKQLEKMGVDVHQAVPEALRAGARVVQQAANEKAPGPHIAIGEVQGIGREAEVEIGPDSEHWYYRYLEYGAGPHELLGTPMRFEPGGTEVVYTPRVAHPGLSAQPFLRPAVDENETEIALAAGMILKKYLPKSSDGTN